jgi:hypothetical protein
MRAIDFFRGNPNSDGRTLDQILAFSDDDLEDHHDIIQWCFPNHQPSNFNPDAPVVSESEQRELAADPAIRAAMRKVLERWLRFYGFRLENDAVVRSLDFAQKSKNWNRPFNHNHLRITRIIRSLRLFGLDHEAQQVFDVFNAFANSQESTIAPSAPVYWHKALTGNLFAPIR